MENLTRLHQFLLSRIKRILIPPLLALLLASRTSAGVEGTAPALTGPILLHADIDQQWGGHTIAYLLEGERALFWSATAFNHGDGTWTQLVGSYPKPGTGGAPVTTRIPVTEANVKSMSQPLLIRSKDGYVHILFGVSHSTDIENHNPGEIRYYRSHAPEDVSQLVDRTELLPKDPPYNQFHLRMNAGVSEDGERLALVILAISADGSVPFNTPVIFQARKQGPDYVFQPPVAYAEPMGLFYPQVAVTKAGTVITGQVWDNAERSLARLIHLDETNTAIFRTDLPTEEDGNHWPLDLRPQAPRSANLPLGPSPSTFERLVLYYNVYPKDQTDCRHEFWTYDAKTRQLEKKRVVPVEPGRINYGKYLPIEEGRSAFLHNPSMGRLDLWEGNLLGEGELTVTPLEATNPVVQGYAGTAYLFVPNALQGSVGGGEETWFAVDYIMRGKMPEARGPGGLGLWRLEAGY